MFRLYNVTGGEIVSQLNSSSGGVRVARGTIVVTLNRLLAGPVRPGRRRCAAAVVAPATAAA